MSTPEIIGPVIDASTLAELAALPVAPFLSGQTAFVTATGRLYVLQNALGTVDNYLLIATADDAARQWVDMAVVTGFVTFVSPLIDFTQVGTYQVITPMAKHLFIGLGPGASIIKDGTITTSPTLKIGNNATNDNLCPSTTPAGFISNNSGTRITITTAGVGILADYDLTANGLRLQITSPAVLGTASYLTGRIIFQSSLQAGPWIP